MAARRKIKLEDTNVMIRSRNFEAGQNKKDK